MGNSDKPGRRPGDVTISNWAKGRGLAIDVAITCPFSVNNISSSEQDAESKKHAFYDEDFKGTQFTFAALVLESTGGINEEGLGLLRQLFRFAAKREGV